MFMSLNFEGREFSNRGRDVSHIVDSSRRFYNVDQSMKFSFFDNFCLQRVPPLNIGQVAKIVQYAICFTHGCPTKITQIQDEAAFKTIAVRAQWFGRRKSMLESCRDVHTSVVKWQINFRFFLSGRGDQDLRILENFGYPPQIHQKLDDKCGCFFWWWSIDFRWGAL